MGRLPASGQDRAHLTDDVLGPDGRYDDLDGPGGTEQREVHLVRTDQDQGDPRVDRSTETRDEGALVFAQTQPVPAVRRLNLRTGRVTTIVAGRR